MLNNFYIILVYASLLYRYHAKYFDIGQQNSSNFIIEHFLRTKIIIQRVGFEPIFMILNKPSNWRRQSTSLVLEKTIRVKSETST